MLLSLASLGEQGLSVVSVLPLRVLGKIPCRVCGGEELLLARARFTIHRHVLLLLHNITTISMSFGDIRPHKNISGKIKVISCLVTMHKMGGFYAQMYTKVNKCETNKSDSMTMLFCNEFL